MKKMMLLVCAALMFPAASMAQQPPSAVPPKEPYSAHQTQAKKELSGKLKSVNKDEHSLTITPAAGGQQDVKLADSAVITRDGVNVGLDKLEPGDDVRANFDPATSRATSLTVQSERMNRAK